jgi:hypothetical protein
VEVLEARLESWTEIKDLQSSWEEEGVEKRTFVPFLRNTLFSENFMILSGLGTSLCVEDDGRRLAPTMQDLWEKSKSKLSENFDSILESVNHPESDKNIELLLSRCQMKNDLEESEDISKFINGIEEVIFDECSFLSDEIDLPVHKSFLRKIIRRSAKLPRAKVFTTNYDLSFEKAASRSGFTIIDGFSHSFPQQFNSQYFDYDLIKKSQLHKEHIFVPNVFQLFKLHGSIDWQRTSSGHICRSNEDKKSEYPVMIYPRSSKFKLSYEQPYFDMMARLQSSLRENNLGILLWVMDLMMTILIVQ